MKQHYFAYIRVSTVKQGERGSSLAEQKSAIEAYAQRYGLTITGWYEETETAAKQGRREFSQMLARLRSHRADGLIIHKIDRSARNLRDWADLGDLIDRGVDVRFVSDNFDLLSRGGRLSADIQAVVAADFIRNLRDEVKKGMYGRLKQGHYPWNAPIGYVNNGKGGKLKTIDPVKGPLIRYLFERYATSTVGFEALRHEMYAKGLRTRGGKVLALHTLTTILNNPFYVGVVRLTSTGETFPGAHEPLISKALFDRVQNILRGKTVPRAKKHQFLFRQMVRCANCERRTLTGELKKGVVYYRCHGRTCQGSVWREDALEAVALKQIERVRIGGIWGRGDEPKDVTDDPMLQDFKALMEEVQREQYADVEHYRASLKLRLQHVDARIDRLTDLLIDGAIDQTAFNARKNGLVLERQEIATELSRSDLPSPVQELLERFERQNTALLQYELLTDDEKRELLYILCSNFSVYGKSSTITLRTPFKEIAEIEDFEECDQDRDKVRTQQVFDVLVRLAKQQDAQSNRRLDRLFVPTSPHPLRT